MKTIITVCSVITLGCLIPVAAQNTQTREKSSMRKSDPNDRAGTGSSGGSTSNETNRSGASGAGSSGATGAGSASSASDRSGSTGASDRSNDSGSGAASGSRMDQSSGGSQTTETTEQSRTGAGGQTTQTTTTTTFNPEARTKVTKYFETHKGSPHGLPPGIAAKVKVKEIPQQWKTSRIEPGMTVQESQRTYLVEAPPELVQQLPEPPAGVRYYIAGSNVIAVDQGYRVVDSIQIPTITWTEESSSSSGR